MNTATAECPPRDVLRCHRCNLVQFRTVSNLCRRCAQPLPPPLRFDTSPLREFSSPAGAAARRALSDGEEQRALLQPRGKTAREFSIGRRLRELREERRLTQQEMAGKAGVPRTYISRIENARLLPGPVMLRRIADALSVAILDLLPSADPSAETALPEDPHYWSSLRSYFTRLRPTEMAVVLEQARTMACEDHRPSYGGFFHAVAHKQ